MTPRLEARQRVGKLIVPFVVDEGRDPIDFKLLDDAHVRACADRRLCGICGERIEVYERLAFVGPRTLMDRACFADPWMHEDCAAVAMEQCPFLGGRREWRQPTGTELGDKLLEPYTRDMVLRTAPAGRSHKDAFNRWHFEAIGQLVEA